MNQSKNKSWIDWHEPMDNWRTSVYSINMNWSRNKNVLTFVGWRDRLMDVIQWTLDWKNPMMFCPIDTIQSTTVNWSTKPWIDWQTHELIDKPMNRWIGPLNHLNFIDQIVSIRSHLHLTIDSRLCFSIHSWPSNPYPPVSLIRM